MCLKSVLEGIIRSQSNRRASSVSMGPTYMLLHYAALYAESLMRSNFPLRDLVPSWLHHCIEGLYSTDGDCLVCTSKANKNTFGDQNESKIKDYYILFFLLEESWVPRGNVLVKGKASID